MGRRIEPPAAFREPERREHPLCEAPLLPGVEGSVEERGIDLGCVANELGQRGPQGREHLAHLGRRHPGLVVVQQCRVGQVGGLEALDVAALELDVLAQVRQERGEIVVPPRLHPGVVAARRCPRHLDAELRRHAARLLPVAPRDANQARVVRLEGQRGLERCEAVEQPTDLRVGEAVVDDAAERRERLGPGLRPERRHRHALLPTEHAGRTAEV